MVNETDLSSLGLNATTLILLLALGDFNNDFFRVGVPTLKARKHCPGLLYKKRKATLDPREERLIGKT